MATIKEIATDLTECTEWEDIILLILYILSKFFSEKQEVEG